VFLNRITAEEDGKESRYEGSREQDSTDANAYLHVRDVVAELVISGMVLPRMGGSHGY